MALLSSISDIWELGLEFTRLAAADIEITEAQREQWTTEERDLVIMKVNMGKGSLSNPVKILHH